MGKNIFATITYVAEKIVEAITGHNSKVDAHPSLVKQINVLSTARGYLTTVQCPNNYDFDLLTKNGKYKVWQGIHAPMSGDRGWLIDVIAENDTNVSQKATSFFPEALSFERSNISGTWSPWEEKVSINDLSTFNIVPTFAGGASGYEGGEIHFIHPPNESQYFTNNAIVQDIVGKTMRFYATTSQGAKLAVIDFESLPVGSATIATTSKTDISFPFNTGYKQANDLGYDCKIVKNSLNEGTIYIAVAKTDGTDFTPNASHQVGNLPLGFRSKFNTVNASSAGDLLVYYPNNSATLIIFNDALFCSCSVACKAIYGQIKYEVV